MFDYFAVVAEIIVGKESKLVSDELADRKVLISHFFFSPLLGIIACHISSAWLERIQQKRHNVPINAPTNTLAMIDRILIICTPSLIVKL